MLIFYDGISGQSTSYEGKGITPRSPSRYWLREISRERPLQKVWVASNNIPCKKAAWVNRNSRARYQSMGGLLIRNSRARCLSRSGVLRRNSRAGGLSRSGLLIRNSNASGLGRSLLNRNDRVASGLRNRNGRASGKCRACSPRKSALAVNSRFLFWWYVLHQLIICDSLRGFTPVACMHAMTSFGSALMPAEACRF